MNKDFSGKKVAVLGIMVEGQSLCDFLLRRRAEITVFDRKNISELGEIYEKYKKKGVSFSLGDNYLDGGLKDFDFVFRSPGFKRLLPEIIKAEKSGVIISSATKLFFELTPAKIIGVTGTKGKGTTATLITEILKKAGRNVFLAGNIGRPMLTLLPKLTSENWVVLELSSFQLQDLKKSPHVAVALFITSDHLDHHQNREEYVSAKANIVRYQEETDFAILNADDETSSSFASLTPAHIFYFSRSKKVKGAYVKDRRIFLFDQLVGAVEKLQLRGAHNWDNVSAAVAAAKAAGVRLEPIKEAVFSFKGLEHRLELVDQVKGASFYNDSFSTTPETAIAAIQAFKKPIILIVGGSEKGSDYADLGKEIANSSVKTLIVIGEMADRIKEAALQAGFANELVYKPGGMKKIVETAFKKADSGDVILLSPACASFDMFKNYKERGRQFKENVTKLH
jgi:UDP-N-acetylmuramoylalanine--D-glutamate ligase